MATDEQLRAMDHEADAALEELVKHLDEWNARDVIKWWANWYMKAGHKRLGRKLVQISKEKNE